MNKMIRLLIPLAIVALVVLAIATLWMATLNWNSKLLGQLLSIAVVGTATAFATVLLSLKETREHLEFTTSLAVGENLSPPMIVPEGKLTKVMLRLQDVSLLSRPLRAKAFKHLLTRNLR